MHANDILNHPGKWKPVSRQEALRECSFRTVMVIFTGRGVPAVSPFSRSSRYFRIDGRFGAGALKYFLKVGETKGHWPDAGGIPAGLSRQGNTLPEYDRPSSAAEPGQAPAIRITGLDCECFAPLVDTVLIHYEITGDLSLARSVHLRIASQKRAGRILLDRKLDGKPLAKGIFMWDGGVSDGDFQGCVNLVGSPYWVRLGLAVGGAPPEFTNQAAIKVELLQVELKVGDSSGLGEDEGNAGPVSLLKEDLKKTPGQGLIHMPGSFFKQDNGEMYSSASFTVYGSFLKNGIPLPLFVKLSLKGKDGGSRRSPQAIAGTRILWDALPDDEAALEGNLADRGVHWAARKFIRTVSLYKQSATEPPGATCQWELGGIRTDAFARRSGRQQFAPLLEDWQSAAPRQRSWAGISVCAKTREAFADSGMIYRNGRIAGDRYHITAYVDLDGSLDDKDPELSALAPGSRKSSTLALRNWRDVQVSRAYKIGAGTAPLTFDEANLEFRKAAISILPKPGLASEEIQAQWKTEYLKVLAGAADSRFIREAADRDPGLYPASFISFADYWEKTHSHDGIIEKIWNRIKAFFGALDDIGYADQCSKAAYRIYSKVAAAFPLGADGLTVFKFGATGDHNRHSGSYTIGMAPFIAGYTTRAQSALFIFSPGNPVRTIVHELGHNLFMPHAPGHWEGGKDPDGSAPWLHDKNQVCIMSYHPEADRFCALCLLRMGGWDQGSIRNDGAVLGRFES